jgi:D-hexose-6-phosphate mutarotase
LPPPIFRIWKVIPKFSRLEQEKLLIKGAYYVDKIRNGQTFLETSPSIQLIEETDRVYWKTNNQIFISATDGPVITLEKVNFPECVVWNPWSKKVEQTPF